MQSKQQLEEEVGDSDKRRKTILHGRRIPCLDLLSARANSDPKGYGTVEHVKDSRSHRCGR